MDNILGNGYMGQNKAKMKNNVFPKNPFFRVSRHFLKDINDKKDKRYNISHKF